MEVTTSHFEHAGRNFYVREGTNDRDVIRSVFQGEYAVPMDQYQPGAVSVDVGAHIGAFSIWACHTWTQHAVLAIEPLPENFELIEENAIANGMRISTLFGAAGSKAVKMVDIGYADENTESGRIHHFVGNAMAVKAGGRVVQVPRFTLSQMLSEAHAMFSAEKIWALKLDCENGEYPLIEEAIHGDLQSIKFIVGEFHDRGIEPLRVKLLDSGFKQITPLHPETCSSLFCFENLRSYAEL